MPAWIILKLFGIGHWLRGLVSGLWTWATKNPLLAVLCVAMLWGFYEDHEAAKWKKVADSTEARRLADAKVWAAADATNHASINTLITSLENWSAATRHWSDVMHGEQQAAQLALRQASARGQKAEALARLIDAEGVGSGSQGKSCRSGDAVIAAKGSL